MDAASFSARRFLFGAITRFFPPRSVAAMNPAAASITDAPRIRVANMVSGPRQGNAPTLDDARLPCRDKVEYFSRLVPGYFVLRTTPRMGCEPKCLVAALLPPAGTVNTSVMLEN